jgi:hypothetical protein
VVLDVLSEPRQIRERNLTQEALGNIGTLARDGQVRQDPERESDDMAVQRVIRVVRHLGCEPAAAEASEDAVHPGQSCRARAARRHEQAAGPRMAQQDVVRREGARAHRRTPIAVLRRPLHLREHGVKHGFQQVALAGDVVVERHRLDAQLLCEPAHAEPFDAVAVGERNARLEHAGAAEGWT